MNCRHCGEELVRPLLDLGASPPSNAYLGAADLARPELWYPLRVRVCTNCWLVQTEDFAASEELFSADYAYFSSTSSSWLEHARNYAEAMIDRFDLGHNSFVVEVASNDGYLLQYFQQRGIRNLGIEPTHSTAAAAREKGLEVAELFFGAETATTIANEHGQADLVAANNVLAHVPDINDFVSGFRNLLKPSGIVTFEFPHLMNLVDLLQFDTVYHEHYSYLSLTAVQRVLAANGLRAFDVEEIPTHGGSLRVFAERSDGLGRDATPRMQALLEREISAGVASSGYYERLQAEAERIKDDLLSFLIEAKREGKKVAGYGAAAKGNTLMNFAGIRPDLVPWVVDRAPSKQGKYLPGSRIPIVTEAELLAEKPDLILILPWNLRQEVMQQLSYAREWGAKFVTAIPRIAVS